MAEKYKIGEFAKLCGVKKDTLFHYDEIGLLKPQEIGENGYRYYGINQFTDFDIIATLKELGTPLKEIKEYISYNNNTKFINLLKEKQNAVELEKKKIIRMEKMLKRTIQDMEEALTATPGKINFLELPTQYLIATPISEKVTITMKSYIDFLSDHYNYCANHDFGEGLRVGEIILYDNIMKGIYRESYYYFNLESKVEASRLFTKPAGLYAVMFYKGSYDMVFDVYKNMKSSIENLGYELAGNIYEEDIIDFVSENDPNSFIVKISMQVKPS